MNHLKAFLDSLKNNTVSYHALLERYMAIRNYTKHICQPLEVEDYVVQPKAEVSPPKWHLAHTTWFFEELILVQFQKDYKRFDESYRLLFNSYYKSAGEHWQQQDRGNLSRPSVQNILDYRDYVDQALVNFLQNSKTNSEIVFLMEVGMHHEQQHQELLYMDIKYILASNPTYPAYSLDEVLITVKKASSWKGFSEGIYEIGFDGDSFAYDNEVPKHKTYLYPYAIQNQSVSNGDYLNFIEDGQYKKPTYWLSDGWDWVENNKVEAPLYWRKLKGQWYEYTLYGLKPLDRNAPLCQISYYEADAYANWTGFRLPTEQELEIYLKSSPVANKKAVSFHPDNANESVGQTWYWTKSHYSPYPNYRTFDGMLGEYNGKFMCGQFVLKGGAIVSPDGHYRNSYRNFYQPHQRWMFSGIRLAKDIEA